MSDQPLRQYPNEDIPQNTTHSVEGDTATDTYHIPGRPLPEEPADNPAADVEVAETSVPTPVLVDVTHPNEAYKTKDNIVLPPEDVRALPTETLVEALVDDVVSAVDRVKVAIADVLENLRLRAHAGDEDAQQALEDHQARTQPAPVDEAPETEVEPTPAPVEDPAPLEPTPVEEQPAPEPSPVPPNTEQAEAPAPPSE